MNDEAKEFAFTPKSNYPVGHFCHHDHVAHEWRETFDGRSVRCARCGYHSEKTVFLK